MTKIAFLGLGAMGARMAANLIDDGHAVTVWNRSEGAASALVVRGARRTETPRAAAADAEIVFAMVRDDAASKAVWLDSDTGALGGMAPGSLAVDCSTVSIEHAAGLAKAMATAGHDFVDAPLAGSRPQAEARALIFFAGGSDDAVARARPVLETLGSAVHHAGASGAGAAVKLMVNTLFGAELAVMAELIGFARQAGLDPARAVEIIGATPVCAPGAKMAAGAMLAGNFAPAFPIDLVVKDFGLVDASARGVAADMPIADATGAVYRRAAAEGFAADNITGVARLYGV